MTSGSRCPITLRYRIHLIWALIRISFRIPKGKNEINKVKVRPILSQLMQKKTNNAHAESSIQTDRTYIVITG